MISRPTTEQILLDCCAELIDGVLPAVTDEVSGARVRMLEGVLREAAARTAHEIAWMDEETAAMRAYVRRVRDEVAVLEGLDPGGEPAVAVGAAAACTAGRAEADSLHLTAVVARYRRAGDAFSSALETARAINSDRLWDEGVAVLEQRVQHERQARGVWSSAAGR